ncbi:unnamed protein product, partial [Medioppia subpectinata]
IHEKDVLAFVNTLADEANGYLKNAQQKYNAQGLNVVSQFYQDAMDAFRPILPWAFGELEKINIYPLQHSITTIIVGQVYDFVYMLERLSELRAVKPLSVTGNEHNLINRLKTLESRVVAAVEGAKKRGIIHVPTFMYQYYDKINAFLNAEFPKLNQAIGNLPSAELRQQIIQQLIIDLTHLTQMPFVV